MLPDHNHLGITIERPTCEADVFYSKLKLSEMAPEMTCDLGPLALRFRIRNEQGYESLGR
jgi:hypothetical protein